MFNHDLIIFMILLLLTIPSVICSIYIFYCFVCSEDLRKHIHNHIILVLIITTFTQVTFELPFTLIFLYNGYVAIFSDKFCQYWIIINYTLFTSSLWTMATATIERYWLVFHRNIFNKYILLIHYIPMILCIVYPLILYIYLVTSYDCLNAFDYKDWTCGGACYLYEPISGTLDWIVNSFLNVSLSTLVTWVIIVRVIIKKQHTTCQRTTWQRSRRIVMQLIALSALYMTVWLPCVICFVITLFKSSPILSTLYFDYLSYYQYLSALLCPFFCLFGSSEIRRVSQENQLVLSLKTRVRNSRFRFANRHNT